MIYEVTDHGVLQSDDRLHYFRVAVWYEADVPTGEPDVVTEFVLPVLPPTTEAPLFDTWGRRQTVSGRWLRPTDEVDGEWVTFPPEGPEGDPWAVIVVERDPMASVRDTINDVALVLCEKGVRGFDIFERGEDAPAVRKPRDQRERDVAKFVGHIGKVRRRLVLPPPAAIPTPPRRNPR